MLEVQIKELARVNDVRPDLVTWMSIEPLSWDISPFLADCCPLKWAVIGAASSGKNTFQPEPEHVENVLSILNAHNVPVFFKGNLEWDPWREDFPASTIPPASPPENGSRAWLDKESDQASATVGVA